MRSTARGEGENTYHRGTGRPLANLIPSSVCDPHVARPRIPAGMKALAGFLRPGGVVDDLCDGDCDACALDEIADGAAKPCDPLAP